jgi:hypothetical protein
LRQGRPQPIVAFERGIGFVQQLPATYGRPLDWP